MERPESRSSVRLQIRTPSENFFIDTSLSATVRELKEAIKRERKQENKVVKLASDSPVTATIFQGQLLEDHFSLSDYGLESGTILHCAITERPASGNSSAPTVELPIRRGFDRLRDAGFTEEEVAEFRSQFLTYTARSGRALPDLEAQIRAEEAWINSEIASAEEELRQQNEQRADYALGRTEDGTTQDLVYGMTMGFLLGFLMFFFLSEGSFSKKTRWGILLGVAFNISAGLIRLQTSL